MISIDSMTKQGITQSHCRGNLLCNYRQLSNFVFSARYRLNDKQRTFVVVFFENIFLPLPASSNK